MVPFGISARMLGILRRLGHGTSPASVLWEYIEKEAQGVPDMSSIAGNRVYAALLSSTLGHFGPLLYF
jgi:hypothetical protein